MTAKKKTTKKTAAKKRGKKTSNKAANDTNLPPLPPAMPGQQEHIPETIDKPIKAVQGAAIKLDEAKKAAAGWGRETQKRLAVLEASLEEHQVEGTYYDGVVKVVRTVKDPKAKLDVEVMDSHVTEVAQ